MLNLYNIPAGYSFVDALAKGILEKTAADPLALGDYTILLPSRRACRTLREAFLRLSGGKPLILPLMRPIGDVAADEVMMLSPDAVSIPPALSRLERQMLLARLILKQGSMVKTFDQAAALALELGHFLDEAQTERLSFDRLEKLVPEAFSIHWQQTLFFLRIVTENWPKILEERGAIDYADRRNRLLEAQVKAWEKSPPSKPVIAAGSTGTVPAAAELLSLVAQLPQGALVFPGLDMSLDAESFAALGAGHPQYNMKRLLARMEATRENVKLWPSIKDFSINIPRVRLLREALRPAETADAWQRLTIEDVPEQALDGFIKIECDTAQEEAETIALIMRETLETPEKTCALITPDRRLARRVALALSRFGIAVDDSGGQPLTELPVGVFLMALAEMAASALAPVPLLSFLKHPFLSQRIEDGMARFLDQRVLRGPRPSPGFAGLRAAVLALDPEKEKRRLDFLTWIDAFEKEMSDIVALFSDPAPKNFQLLLTVHLKAAEKSALEGILWKGAAGEAASRYLSELLASARDVPDVTPSQYLALLQTLFKTVTVRPDHGTHPRLSILGQIEARLFSADRVILGGLNEGTWPEDPPQDPWMSRPMRKDFGLPAPEKSIGLAAHDFVQAGSAKDVILTRAQKVDGTPTVPARFLLRIDAVLKAVGLNWPLQKAAQYRAFVAELDRAVEVRAIDPPRPTPDVSARPRALSVTQVEKWMRDPYQIYARHILKLDPLDPLDADPGGAERGTFIHKALENFIKAFPNELPQSAVEALLDFGRKALLELRIPDEVEAFWWPRFERAAAAFVAEEKEWRKEAKPLLQETKGTWTIDDVGAPFVLTGKADRIDRLSSGGYAIIDYKTGTLPGKTEITQGLFPQLPLEAVMLEQGAFPEIKEGEVQSLLYWRISGAGEDPVLRKDVFKKEGDLRAVMDEAGAGFRDLIRTFDLKETPYITRASAKKESFVSDYAHLSRIKEWGLDDAGGEDEAA